MKDSSKLRLKREGSTSFAKNVLMLAAAQIIVKILGLIYKIIIVNVPGFGDTGNGFYSAGYQLYMVLLAISSIGVPNVVSKLVSERIAVDDHKGAYKVFKVSFGLITSVGFILSAFMFVFAKSISVALFGDVGVAYTLMALSPAVLFVSSNSVLRGYFTGLGSLKSTSISEIVEQTFNCLLSILFVYMASGLGTNTAIMAAAGNLSTSLAAMLSLAYMISHFLLQKKFIKEVCIYQKAETENISTKSLIKTITFLAIPAAFASLVSTLSSNIDSITVSKSAGGVEAFGLLSKTETLTHMPLALSATLYIAIVPVISALMKKGDKESAQKKLSDTLFFSNIIIFPCAIGFVVLAQPILTLLYPAANEGAFLLLLQTVAMLFSAVTYILNGIFYGLGQQKYPAIILLIGTCVKLGLNILFLNVLKLSVTSAVISTIIYQALVTMAEIIVLNRFVKVRIKLVNQLLKPLVSSLIMGAAVFFFYKLLLSYTSSNIATISSIFVGVVVYFAAILIMKTLTKEDCLNLPKGDLIYRILNKFKFI